MAKITKNQLRQMRKNLMGKRGMVAAAAAVVCVGGVAAKKLHREGCGDCGAGCGDCIGMLSSAAGALTGRSSLLNDASCIAACRDHPDHTLALHQAAHAGWDAVEGVCCLETAEKVMCLQVSKGYNSAPADRSRCMKDENGESEMGYVRIPGPKEPGW